MVRFRPATDKPSGNWTGSIFQPYRSPDLPESGRLLGRAHEKSGRAGS